MKPFRISLFGGALLLVAPQTQAMQTDNFGLHAVPAPANLQINGRLDEWDLSGEVLMTYDIEALQDIYSARVATMYDAENLYIAVKWKDPIPLGNSHDPRYQAGKAWAGDSLQLRFKTDRIAHVTAWGFAPRQEPAMTIGYGKNLTEPFGGPEIQLFQKQGAKMDQGAEMAFSIDADKRGYTQEIKLPWKLIAGKGFKAGEKFGMGVELLWGEDDWPVHRYADNLQPGTTSRQFFWTAHQVWGPVILEPKGRLKLPEPAYLAAYRRDAGATPQGPVEIAYNLPREARVSLAIDDQNGNRVRNLVASQKRSAGRNVEKWDGLNDDGKPVAPGNYRFKAIYHDGIRVNYALSFNNPGQPTWTTSDGKGAFYGDHTAPIAAAAAGDFVALATPIGEAGQPLIATDLLGQRLWGQANRVFGKFGIQALATDGKTLWVGAASSPPVVYRVEIASGKYAPWNQTARDANGAEYRVLELPVSDKTFVDTRPKDANGATLSASSDPNLSALSIKNGVLAVALKHENLVKWMDAETGISIAQIAVAAPQAVTFASSTNDLIVLSRGKLLRVSNNGKTSAYGAGDFVDGYGLTSDNQGHVFLSTRGANHNVLMFDESGKLVREIGKRGGRPNIGRYDANGMRNPAGIAVDSLGRLWVTEETMNPKRTSVWNTQTGALILDLAGTTTYAGAGSLNPFDPTIGFSDGAVFRLDLNTGTSRPIYSLAMSATSGTDSNPNNLFPPAVHNLVSRVVKRGDLTYIYTSGNHRGGLETHVTLWDGQHFRSVAHVGTVPKASERDGDFAKYAHPFFVGQEGRAYAWADKSGDGIVARDELTFANLSVDETPVTLASNYWGQLPDDAGTIPYLASGRRDVLLKFPIRGTTKVGAPIYDIANPQILRLNQPIINVGEGSISGGSSGRVYLNQDPLTAVDESGKVLFSYPNRHVSVHGSHSATSAKPGYLIGPSSILGTAPAGDSEVFYLNGNLGENYLFTHDGLYIQTLFKDTRGYFDIPNRAVKGLSMDATTAGGESFGGNFVRAIDGKTYVTLGGTDARVMEVTGLDSLRRLEGNITYSPAQYAQAQTLLEQKTAIGNTPKAFRIARGAAPTLNGQAQEWPELLDDSKPLLEIAETGGKRFARVAARYDDAHLYLAYRVFAPRESMQNAGQDERLLFKTGDAVDLMIGPMAQNENGAGNSRVLMTVRDETPIAILNQKVAPGASTNEKYTFSSPWRTFTFDRVVRAPEVKIASGPIAGGFFVEAAIPWKTLGIVPRAGLQLRADVGALFADAGGTQTIARHYWSNKATGLVNDVPGEAELTPHLWGTWTLE